MEQKSQIQFFSPFKFKKRNLGESNIETMIQSCLRGCNTFFTDEERTELTYFILG